MISLTDLIESLGPGMLRMAGSGRDAQVHDVVLPEPGEAVEPPGECAAPSPPTRRRPAPTTTCSP